jgi:hypothetical protein
MHRDYEDIRSRIAEPPQWFDENAVPRYCPFAPQHVANLYACEVVLAEIACQACGRLFHVAFSMDLMEQTRTERTLEDLIRGRHLHYGDPPNVGCCAVGPTMNSVPRRVLEYWRCHHREYVGPGGTITDMRYFDWRREPALELSIEPDWVKGEPQ